MLLFHLIFMFRVLQIPAFRVPGFTDSGFSCSGFYRFRLFMFRVLQIPAFHVPGFLVPCSVPRSVPRFPVPCFTDSLVTLFTNTRVRLPNRHTHAMLEIFLPITSKDIHHFINMIYFSRVNDVKRHLICIL